MAAPRRDRRLTDAARDQVEDLVAATRDPERAAAVLWALIDHHDAARARADSRGLDIHPVAPPGRSIAEGVLAVADELLVWDKDTADAVRHLAGGSITATPDDDVVTPNVRRLRLAPAGSRAAGGDRLAEAVTILDRQGIRSSFDHAVVHNGRKEAFEPIRPFMTAKGSVPPLLPPGYTLPPRPEIPEGARRVKVAVIDTGAEVQRDDPKLQRTDGWLREVAGADDPGTAGFDASTPLDPGAGHGSAVAGVVEMMAPTAEVTSYVALYAGMGSEVDVARAILRAAADGAEVINLSLGTPALPQHAPLAIEDALAEVPEHVLVVAAAGNSGSHDLHFPAAFKRVIAVGATDADYEPAEYSNRGFWVDVSTRGTGIATTFTQGTFDHGGAPVTFSGTDPVAAVTGTSFAAPQVAGALAQLLSEGHTPTEAVAKLKGAGRPVPDFGVVVPLLEQ